MAFTSRRAVRSIVILLFMAGSAAAFFDFPKVYNASQDWLRARTGYALPNTPDRLPFLFGLDIQGGTHLVYEADVTRLGSADVADAMNGVRDVIERRVNTFGVGEPVVQTNRAGDAWRLIVELPGVHDVTEAIHRIGETPILEFREQNTDGPRELTEAERKDMNETNGRARTKAVQVLQKVLAGRVDFADVAKEFSEDAATKEQGGALGYINDAHPLYAEAQRIGRGRVNRTLIDRPEAYEIIRVDNIREGEKEVQARHILVCYAGAERCDASTTKEDAFKQITELRTKATIKNFADLAKEHSTDPTAKENGGSLGWITKNAPFVERFKTGALALTRGQISQPVETEFGYHLILAEDARTKPEYDIRHILVDKKTEAEIRGPVSPWKTTALSGKHLKRASVQFDQTTGAAEIKLEMTGEGSTLFAEITKRNVGKPLGIFLDGKAIIDTDGDRVITDRDVYAPVVQQEITGGNAVITGLENVQKAREITRRLNAGALPIPITLIAQETVGAALGNESVARSLTAGLLGFALVALFMILYYRLPGFLAVLALILYAVFLLFLFKSIPVTLTLSGIAGFILTLGMAVDANILIFERMKEELHRGASLQSAIEDGFSRAWPSIRDGNLTTIIAAVILFWFSSSLIKGFALTLFLGVLMSMFTALTCTRYLLMIASRWFRASWLYGVTRAAV